MGALIVREAIPPKLIVPGGEVLNEFKQKLGLHALAVGPSDMHELVSQVAEVITNLDEKRGLMGFLEEMRSLPTLERVGCRAYFYESIERQHVIKAAMHAMGARLYSELNRLGAFQVPFANGTFPYIFTGLHDDDLMYSYLTS